MLPLIISIASIVVGMVGCYRLFKRNDKNTLLGLAIGFAFGVVGLVVASVVLRNPDRPRARSFRFER